MFPYIVEFHLAERQLKKVFDTHKHTHGLEFEFSRVSISEECDECCSWMAYLGDRSLAVLAILYTAAYGNMELINGEHVTTEAEPSLDTSSARDDD